MRLDNFYKNLFLIVQIYFCFKNITIKKLI